MNSSQQCRYVSPRVFDHLCHDVGLTGGLAESPFGPVMIRLVGDSICGLGFADCSPFKALHNKFFDRPYKRDDAHCQHVIDTVLNKKPASLVLAGTPFQHDVWHHLQEIHAGHYVSYQTLAERLGDSNKTRAVASAVARNPIAWLVPCHRVLPKKGGIGDYYWGPKMKATLLKWEGCNWHAPKI